MVAKHHLLMLLLASAAALAHAGITLTPNKLSKNGEEIIVSWSDIPTVGNRADPDNQMNADQIVMLQSDAPDLASKWPIKYIWAKQAAPETYLDGSGLATFWVVNHRQPLRFLYLRYPSINNDTATGPDFAWGNQTILAEVTLGIDSNLLKAPHQLRLSLLGFNSGGDDYDGYDEASAKLSSATKGYEAEDEPYSGPEYYKSQAPHRTYNNDPSRGDYGSYRDADSYYKQGSDSYSYKPEYSGGDDKDSYYKTGGGDDYYKGDERDGYDARRHYPKDDYEYYNGPANEGPHNNPYGRDVQITWQSTLPGGIAVAAHDIEDVNNYLAFAKKHVEAASMHYGGGRERPERVHVVPAGAEKYTPEDMCGFPANSVGWLDPGYNNFAVWRGLQHNTLYHYFVGSAESGFSAVRNFTTPPLARSDCYKVPFTGQPCDGYHCSKECLKHVDTVKLLLAADVGTNNHRDGTWSADGQGFFAINSAQSAEFQNDTLTPGVIWPKRTYVVSNGGYTLTIPYANVFYGLLAMADFPAWGQQPATYWVAEAMNKLAASGKYHSAFIVGDLAYAEGVASHWDMFLTDFEPTFSSVPTMFSNGNHESASDELPEDGLPPDPESKVPDSGNECGIVYEKRMRMPTPPNIANALRPEYYSYTIGPIAVIVLSTEQKFNESSIQYKWLVGEFEQFAKLRAEGKLPWLVVAFHRPMYVDDPDISLGIGNQWVAEVLLEQLEPLFARYQVDMTWTGHTHFYHRSYPTFKRNNLSQPITAKDGHKIYAPVHVMVGNGGFQPGASIFNTTPPWVDVEKFEYGYCTIEASQTNLDMECFNAENGNKFDEMSLYKPAGWRPCPEEAEKYYESLPLVDNPIGINVTAELGPTIDFLVQNIAKLEQWANSSILFSFSVVSELMSYFDDSSPNGQLLNAYPGSRVFSMADVSPIYTPILQTLYVLDIAVPPELRLPAAEEIEYLYLVNTGGQGGSDPIPAGRLWKMLKGIVPK